MLIIFNSQFVDLIWEIIKNAAPTLVSGIRILMIKYSIVPTLRVPTKVDVNSCTMVSGAIFQILF